MGNSVVHFEVMGTDALALQKFYADLFGWHVQNMEDMGNYGLVDTHAGGGINGAIGAVQDGTPFVTFYVAVPDLDTTLNQIESLGGAVAMPPVEIPGVVTFAQFTDPLGNVVGIIKDGEGENPGVSPGDGIKVEWFEVLSSNPSLLVTFYSTVFGWTEKPGSGSGDGGFEYHEMDTSATSISGGIGATPDGSNHVTLYAQVDDVAKYLEAAESLGAKTIMGPQDMGGTRIGVFLDPQGLAFGLFSPIG